MSSSSLFLGNSREQVRVALALAMANRHGLVAGATGTGKTVTLRTLAEGFSRAGVPVFTADVKGDLAGLAYSGGGSPKIDERLALVPVPGHTFRGFPVVMWDVFGKQGLPLRTTLSELGPVLLSRLLELNETQTGAITIAFKIADDEGMLLLDLKDLRELLHWLGERGADVQSRYGNVTKATIGAIQRGLLTLEEAGGAHFFGEPALRLEHLMQRDFSGNGVISILDATSLINNPRIYSTLLLWLLSELFEKLPEVGDVDLPTMVFFFDEAHLLFEGAPPAFLEKIEQVVRLIRSKGVGVYFVTQNPIDIPDTISAQLGNRVQHALRAFTAKDQKAVRAAAETFRENPKLNTSEAIVELEVGEALVSVLDAKGIPTPVERVLIAPPESRIGAISPEERAAVIARSPLKGIYEQCVDRESAYEVISRRLSESKAAAPVVERERIEKKSTRMTPLEAMVSSAARAVGNQLGREFFRGVLGSIMGGRR